MAQAVGERAKRDVEVLGVGFDAGDSEERRQQCDGASSARIFGDFGVAHQVDDDQVVFGVDQECRRRLGMLSREVAGLAEIERARAQERG